MELHISQEQRAMAAKHPNMITDVPSSTPAHIVARLVAGTVAFCEKRSVTATEERSYQAAAARNRHDLTLDEFLAATRKRATDPIHAQIAAWNQRHASKRTMRADARSLAAEYPELSMEDISRALRLGYSEDTMLQLRAAAITKTIRAGFAFEAQSPSPRYQSGSAEDPQQSLRKSDDDDDFDFDDYASWDDDEHQRCATYHRALAAKSDTWQKGAAQHTAADLHDKASRGGDSRAARAASKRLLKS